MVTTFIRSQQMTRRALFGAAAVLGSGALAACGQAATSSAATSPCC